ncbi:autotransporter assembly complex protein TamA [Candidatus Schneideria nysicola]|uniref:autotransporter assembly complex protein TamA n=1 Tax=Candidatus Schneideria nysicola TaxID=1081631 RepID=UPI001CAA6E95|nr:autotransporter assembly complex family protein [Candidatus Schneideria nysicola]UAJ65849.1 outer membrane protein assembly factor [Candidatus Schneideria nysicola]
MCIALICKAEIQIKITGIDNKELKNSIFFQLSNNLNLTNITINNFYKKRIENLVKECLHFFGYYTPTIFTFFNKEENIITLHITIGKPTIIVGIQVVIYGEAKNDIDFQNIIKKTQSNHLGKKINHREYENFKNDLLNLAIQKGYLDSVFKKHQLSVFPNYSQAYWDIIFDSGKRYCFNKLNFSGSQIREDYLKNIYKIQEGDPYNVKILADLNHRLISTDWFSSVRIEPNMTKDKEEKILTLNTILIPNTTNNIETGVGYTTGTGPEIKIIWNKPWINSRGYRFDSDFSIAEDNQKANLALKIPLFESPLEKFYLIKSRFNRQNINNVPSYLINLDISRYWNIVDSWKKAINLRCSFHYKPNIKKTTILIYPGIYISRIRQKGDIIPIWGDSQRYLVDVSYSIWSSDVNFFVFQAQNTWIRTIAKKNRFIIRTNFGWIGSDNFKYVPFSLRFFAGGEYSIRGYKYNVIYPKDSEGKCTGASRLAIGSIEYQYNFFDKCWFTIFIDGGEATNKFRNINYKIGIGSGLRWITPIGPIKLDCANKFTKLRIKKGLQFHFGLGSEL